MTKEEKIRLDRIEKKLDDLLARPVPHVPYVPYVPPTPQPRPYPQPWPPYPQRPWYNNAQSFEL